MNGEMKIPINAVYCDFLPTHITGNAIIPVSEICSGQVLSAQFIVSFGSRMRVTAKIPHVSNADHMSPTDLKVTCTISRKTATRADTQTILVSVLCRLRLFTPKFKEYILPRNVKVSRSENW